MSMDEQMSRMERTLLELGTEVFRLGNEMSAYREASESLSKAMRGLRQILDDKGMISSEDFDEAVGSFPQSNIAASGYEGGFDDSLLRMKKVSH